MRLLSLLAADSDVELTLINTGQHYDWNMLKGFLEELDAPEVTVDLAVGPGRPSQQTAALIARVADFLLDMRPDVLCVFGDTNSSLAGAVAAARTEIPVAHIEAGCRSFDMSMPEEINRRLIDHMAGLLLAVSEVSHQNLVRENVLGRIQVVGDPLFDIFVKRRPPRPSAQDRLQGLITLHRPSNVDNPEVLREVLKMLGEASNMTGVKWIFPVHPRTRRGLDTAAMESIRFVEPFLYDDLLRALAESQVCVTDSGGLQKEAMWMEVPCVTVRTSTEWLETVDQGVNKLAPPGTDITGAVLHSLSPAQRDFSNPYGDGHASEYIVAALKQWISEGARFDLSPSPDRPRFLVS